MQKEVSLKDGTTLKIYAGNSLKLASFGGQHVNDSAYWVKAQGFWWRLDKRYCGPKLVEALECLDNVDELELLADKVMPIADDEI